MNIPLGYFLIAWAALLGLYGILVFVTLIQTLRHGIAAPFMYASTFIFLFVIAIVIGGCGIFFMRTNWSTTVNVLPSSVSTFFDKTPEAVLGDIPLN